ncbi:type III secretion HpaP family protein [Paraburkholderia bonniea]|uniref:type III secretion HpaP family protein n=1 Tax=Paraburkholderia bonniea TaxID=2152891 RepID=UPI0015804B41|nr:type III secretion HpaP family protein [Paraburkholderia bonniea]
MPMPEVSELTGTTRASAIMANAVTRPALARQAQTPNLRHRPPPAPAHPHTHAHFHEHTRARSPAFNDAAQRFALLLATLAATPEPTRASSNPLNPAHAASTSSATAAERHEAKRPARPRPVTRPASNQRHTTNRPDAIAAMSAMPAPDATTAAPAPPSPQVCPITRATHSPASLDTQRLVTHITGFCCSPVALGGGRWEISLELNPALLPGTRLHLKLSSTALFLRFDTRSPETSALLSNARAELQAQLENRLGLLIEIETECMDH